MGRLIYTRDSSFEIDDKLLAHLRVVTTNKLRRSEGFTLQFATIGGGRMSIWISPSSALMFQLSGGREPKLDRELLDQMMREASGSDGLTLSSRM